MTCPRKFDEPTPEQEAMVDAIVEQVIEQMPVRTLDPAISFKPCLGDLDRLRGVAKAQGKSVAQVLRDAVRIIVEGAEG